MPSMSVYLWLTDINRYLYTKPVSNKRVLHETHFYVSSPQEGWICPNYFLLRGKTKNFKNILTKLATHKMALESERRKELLIINQRGSTNFRANQNWRKSWEKIHVIEKSLAKGHWKNSAHRLLRSAQKRLMG